MSATYTETVHRWVVEAVDLYPADTMGEYRQAKIDAGIDPDEDWRLIWSFTEQDYAQEQMEEEKGRWGKLRKWRVRDLGEPKQIERSIW